MNLFSVEYVKHKTILNLNNTNPNYLEFPSIYALGIVGNARDLNPLMI